MDSPTIDYHHMTSVVCRNASDVSAVEQIVKVVTDNLKSDDVQITRIKLEKSPTPKGSVAGECYYECHVEVFGGVISRKLYDPAFLVCVTKHKQIQDGPRRKAGVYFHAHSSYEEH